MYINNGGIHMDYRKKTILASVTGLTLEGMDIMFISFAMSIMVAEFGVGLAAGGMMSSVTNIGMLLGGVIFGILADKYGRVRVFTYTIYSNLAVIFLFSIIAE